MGLNSLSREDELKCRRVVQKVLDNPVVANCLDELRAYDEYTYEHSYQVCVIALKLGVLYYLTEEALVELGTAAILHDYGKVRVPIAIITKPERLSEDEFSIVMRHPLEGALELQRRGLSKSIVRAVAEHHEGSEKIGYPFGIAYSIMSLYSRIILVADIYDALTNKRVYRRYSLEAEEVVKMLLKDCKVDNHIMGLFDNT